MEIREEIYAKLLINRIHLEEYQIDYIENDIQRRITEGEEQSSIIDAFLETIRN